MKTAQQTLIYVYTQSRDVHLHISGML